MEFGHKTNPRASILSQILSGRIKNGEWIPVLLCAFPIIATGLYKGGEAAIAIYLLGLYIVFLVSWGFMRENKIIIEKNIFFVPIAIFVVSSFIATIFSPAFFSSIPGFIEYFSYFLFFLSLLILKPGKKKFLLLIFIFSLVELIVCFTEIKGARVSGTYNYASYIVIPLFFGLLYSFSIKRKTIKFILMALFLGTALLTGSRIVFVLILTLPFLIFEKKILWTIVPVLILAALLIPNPVGRRIKGKADIYSYQRPNLWKQAIKTALDRPITGWGHRNFEKVSLKYNFPVKGRYARAAKIAHNQFLQYFADGGIIFLFAYMLLFYVFFLNFRNMNRMERTFIALILIHSLFDNPIYLPTNFLMFLSVLYISGKKNQEYHINLSHSIRRLIPLLAIIYLLPLFSNYIVKRGERAFRSKDFEKASSFFSIGEALWPIPRNTLALSTVYEQFFLDTKEVDNLYYAFHFYQRAMESDPLDWKIPVETYKFLMRNKKNVGVKDPAKFLEKAIELNPKERKLYEMLIDEYQKEGRIEEINMIRLEMQKTSGPSDPSKFLDTDLH